MKTSVVLSVIIVIIVALGAWYVLTPHTANAPTPTGALGTNGSPNQGNTGAPDTGTPQQPNDQGMQDNGVTGVSQNLVLGVSSTASLGQFLSAYNGMTLYMYTPDKAAPGKSVCNGGCAAAWPPYTVASAADIHVPATLTTSKVSTITRDDGTLQVAYNGKPLYFYAKDSAAGDVKGQGVGGVWYVVKP